MKHQKKGFRIVIASFLSIIMLSNTPMWMTTVESKKPHQKKHQHANQDDTDVVDDQSNSHSDSDDTNSNDDQHESSTDQNAENERQWKQYLGEQNENKVQYFKELPRIVLDVFLAEKVEVKFLGGWRALGKPLFEIKKKKTPKGSDVIFTKDQSKFSRRDTDRFWEAMSKFTVDKLAEAGKLVSQELLDVLNELKKSKTGNLVLYTEAFKKHEGSFDFDFLQGNLDELKRIVVNSIELAADPNERSTLEVYAAPMWGYLSGHRDAPKNKTLKFTAAESDAAESWAKQESEKWKGVMTAEERAALEIYTGGYSDGEVSFEKIQEQLRKNKGNPGSIKSIDHINNIFRKMSPISEGLTVYRGLKELFVSDLNDVNLKEYLDKLNNSIKFLLHLNPDEYSSRKSRSVDHLKSREEHAEQIFKETGKDFRYTLENHNKFKRNFKQFEELLKDRTIKEYGYMSTSLIPDIAKDFSNGFFVELSVPKGAKAMALTSDLENGNEFELLFPSGTEYIVKSIELVSGKNPGVKITGEVRLPERTDTDTKNAEFNFVGNAEHLGGGHEKYLMQDKTGDKWLFKVSGSPGSFDWVSEAEVGANKLLNALGRPAVEIRTGTFDIPRRGKLSGSIQKMIELQTWGLGKMNVSELSSKQLKQLQEEQIVDYLIANLDCHEDNFGIDHSGNIVTFDKGQALKHLGDSSKIAQNTLNPDSIFSLVDKNEYIKPYYVRMWNGWLGGKFEMDLMAVKPFIEKIEGLPDEDFADMFRAYAEGREKQIGKSSKEFLDALVERKNTIRSRVETFYKELARQKGISFEGFSSDAVQVPVDKLAS